MARPLMKHNPAFLTREDLVRSFVVRHGDLELLLERLREGGEGPNQHMLLIGPRGSGKTTLVLRVAAAVEAEPVLRGRWYPLVFGEESYEVGTAAEFWLEAILHLADQTGQARWRAIYDELKTQKDEKRLYEQALARLMDFADEQGKRLLIVAENLNMILGEQLSSDDGWVLRHTLQNEHRIMLLATATTRFDEIDSVDKAMYDLFWAHDLRPLDAEECRKLWTTITGQEISQGRIRPIQILTGGSPRLLAILATFASGLSFQELMAELAQLVDDHTSYFKSNLESLPVLERKVYVTLADIWSPATAREVAASARVEVNKVSSLLHRLESRGAVVEVKQERRKTSYQVAERMYNIYHLMRRRGAEDSRVLAVVDFMVHLYEQKDLVRVTQSLAEEACVVEPGSREDHFQAYAGILRLAGSSGLKADIVKSTDARFFGLADAPPFIRRLLPEKVRGDREDALRARIANVPNDAVARAYLALVILDRPERLGEAEQLARKAVEVAPEQAFAWAALGAVLLEARRFDEAEHVLEDAVRRYPDNEGLLIVRAQMLKHRKMYDDAADIYERHIEITPGNSGLLVLLGRVRFLQGRNVDAEKAYRGAIEAEPSDPNAWKGLGAALARQSRWQDAEEAFLRAGDFEPADADVWCSLSAALLAQSKIDEASVASQKAMQCDPSGAPSWVLLGSVETYRGNQGEAEKAYRKAVELAPKDEDVAKFLNNFVSQRLQTPDAASRAGRRFLRATRGRAVGLDALARKVFKSGWTPLYPDAEFWSREAVTAEPDNLRFRFTLACLSGALGKWPAALAEAARFLADLAFARENMTDIIDFFIGAAAAGQAKEALACLTASPAKPQLEPLLVALQMVLGDDYNAPQEVVEVAKDVVERINARKQAPAAPSPPAKPERIKKKRRPPSPRAKAPGRGGRG